jgi:hypothetical protein
MNHREHEETRDLWNRVADDWRIQVGDEGDSNRLLNSDPVLWAFAGEVNGRVVGICRRNSMTEALWSRVLTSPSV